MKKPASKPPVAVVVNETCKVVFRCNTVREAECFIAGIELVQPVRVHEGYYGIDAPEELVNPN